MSKLKLLILLILINNEQKTKSEVITFKNHVLPIAIFYYTTSKSLSAYMHYCALKNNEDRIKHSIGLAIDISKMGSFLLLAYKIRNFTASDLMKISFIKSLGMTKKLII